MDALKFVGSVVATASLGTLILGSIVKVLNVVQTKAAFEAGSKTKSL